MFYVKYKVDARDFADGAFTPGHRRFVETLRANLKKDPEFELVRLSLEAHERKQTGKREPQTTLL